MVQQEALNLLAAIFGDYNPQIEAVSKTIAEPQMFGQEKDIFYIVRLKGAQAQDCSINAALQEINATSARPIKQEDESDPDFQTEYFFCSEIDIFMTSGNVLVEGWKYIKKSKSFVSGNLTVIIQ